MRNLEKYHPIDNIAISSWVMKNKDWVILYKPQNSSVITGNCDLSNVPDIESLFVLGIQRPRMLTQLQEGIYRIVCIDDTHGTNQYGFYLYNFIMPDRFGNGYPVAHYITNRKDADTLTAISYSLKNKCPILELYVVMTDDDAALRQSISNLFDHSVKLLLCKWHV